MAESDVAAKNCNRSGDIGAKDDRQRDSHSLWGFAAEQSKAKQARAKNTKVYCEPHG